MAPTIGSAAVAALLFAIPALAASQDDAIAVGRAFYHRECAPCHGESGNGNGRSASGLSHPPPDLTRFRDRTTPFPRARIADVISGRVRLAPSHGSTQMPRWRDVPLEPLLRYLESIQARQYDPRKGLTLTQLASIGRPLYRSHCAGCHGASGRGPDVPPPAGAELPPDLTTMALRNGEFDAPKVLEFLTGRRSTEEPGMPDWRRAFEHAGWSRGLTQANLEALTSYLLTIQRQ